MFLEGTVLGSDKRQSVGGGTARECPEPLGPALAQNGGPSKLPTTRLAYRSPVAGPMTKVLDEASERAGLAATVSDFIADVDADDSDALFFFCLAAVLAFFRRGSAPPSGPPSSSPATSQQRTPSSSDPESKSTPHMESSSPLSSESPESTLASSSSSSSSSSSGSSGFSCEGICASASALCADSSALAFFFASLLCWITRPFALSSRVYLRLYVSTACMASSHAILARLLSL